jgi:D-alanine-D-alanine ligase
LRHLHGDFILDSNESIPRISVETGVTRIGFAYNQKPEQEELSTVEATAVAGIATDGETGRPDEISPPPTDEFAEWDSIETIDAVASALESLGEVIRLEADDDFPLRLRETRPDIVFNIAEGKNGVNREAHVPSICEFYGIPYSGSDPLTLSLCLDKARTKEALSHHGIPTARFAVVRDVSEIRRAARALEIPVFVKPIHEGSSKGITERNFCRTFAELKAQATYLLGHYEQPVIVEEYLPGAEFTCAVLGNGRSARVLPIVGMNFDSLPEGALPIYGFEAKWIWDRPERPLAMFDCPAKIDDPLRRAIDRVTLDAYRVLGCRDWSRIDIRLDADGVPNVVEVNPLPGILPDPADNSCFPKAARAAGISYEELIQSCLRLAASRQNVPLRRQFGKRAIVKKTRAAGVRNFAAESLDRASSKRLSA